MVRQSGDVDRWVGRAISERRQIQGLSQSQLAKALGLSFQQIQKYESGANRLSAGRLFELSHLLQCPIQAFFPSNSAELSCPPASSINTSVEGRILAEHFPRIQDRAVRRSVAHIVEVLALG